MTVAHLIEGSDVLIPCCADDPAECKVNKQDFVVYLGKVEESDLE